MENKRIFIIEDDVVILSSLEAKLSLLGFQVVTSNGDDAIGGIIKKIISEKINYIILDLVLPGVSGFELLKKIKEEASSVPVFIFSDFSEKDIAEKCANLGAEYYYIKQDFSADNFASKVEKIINNRGKI